jgi:hypothetical protein
MLAVIVVAMLSVVGAEPKQSDWDWLTEHRTAVFDALMPNSTKAQVVTYRSYRDLYVDVPERYFSIQIPQGQALEAVVVAPQGLSLQRQLLDLHMAEPAASFESLVTRVQVTRVALKASTCPAIQEQLDRLGRLRFTVPDMDIIILHPDLHHVVVDAGGGTVDAVLQQDEHPLVKWCLETLAAIQRCPPVR